MTLVKWTPKRNMFNVFDDVEKMVNQAFGHSIRGTEVTSQLQPLLDVYETDRFARECALKSIKGL